MSISSFWQVKHSKTTKSSSYARDFADLIHHYTKERTTDQHNGSSLCGTMEVEQCLDEMGEDENVNETELDEQYLEDDESEERMAADFDGTCSTQMHENPRCVISQSVFVVLNIAPSGSRGELKYFGCSCSDLWTIKLAQARRSKNNFRKGCHVQ